VLGQDGGVAGLNLLGAGAGVDIGKVNWAGLMIVVGFVGDSGVGGRW
jgi:hypothetical protein